MLPYSSPLGNYALVLSLGLLMAYGSARAQDTTFRMNNAPSRSTAAPKTDSLPPAQFSKPTAGVTDSLSLLHNPRKAALLSAVLPGLGQAYNHKYWKIPIAYAGLATATGFFVFNYKQFLIYRDAYRLVSSNQKSTNADINTAINLYSPSDLQIIRDGYRQYVDYSVLGFAAVYFLDILDAVVDAHLYYFNVNPDLTLRLLPCAGPDYAGLGLVLNLDHPSKRLRQAYPLQP
ncbi:MAG TPA: DUF5683 domain-containing protein [Chitinophagaceae bacterium]|nr:DUF5683 domain-containing protein [Chitinophagaceae bacterium]